MSQIPEGATHRSQGHYYKKEGPSWMLYGSASQWIETACLWEWLDENADPLTPERTGEGLPPVGTVCEMQNAIGIWREVEIFAEFKGNVFGWDGGELINYFSNKAEEFRPIRTPEQIAVEAREKAINAMAEILTHDGSFFQDAERLYDAGYRLFEITDE